MRVCVCGWVGVAGGGGGRAGRARATVLRDSKCRGCPSDWLSMALAGCHAAEAVERPPAHHMSAMLPPHQQYGADVVGGAEVVEQALREGAALQQQVDEQEDGHGQLDAPVVAAAGPRGCLRGA